ncbi:hypothetical protein FKM82_025877 [Ascaphus truei]
MGVLKWVDWTVSEPRYFQLQTDHTPVHLALLDEISTCHQLLHPQVLQLLIKLFETEHSQLDVMEQVGECWVCEEFGPAAPIFLTNVALGEASTAETRRDFHSFLRIIRGRKPGGPCLLNGAIK